MHDEDRTFAGAAFRLVKGAIKRIGAGFDRHKFESHQFTISPNF
jgi:hypothetical protein